MLLPGRNALHTFAGSSSSAPLPAVPLPVSGSGGGIDPLLTSAGALLHAGEFAAAREQYNQALLANVGAQRAHAGLYYACTALGDQQSAAMHLSKALQLQAIVTLPYRGSDPNPVTILLLQSIHAGNVLIQRLLDDRIFRTHVLIVEFYEPWMPLPPHHVVVNAIGDADIRAEALTAAQSVLARTQAPVLNSPQAVAATGRCQNAQRLAMRPGISAPLTVTIPRDVLETEGSAALTHRGLSFPLLLRAPGYHMGQHFHRIDAPADLPAALAELPPTPLIAIQFLDGSGADGLIRKYRVLIVDGELYPVHLAVSDHWKVHYFSADMAEHPKRRAEDAAFLADMPGILGPCIMAALAEIRDTLGLDYGGVDFGISQPGELLLWEANANMAIIRPDANPLWDYRRAAIERIHAAVHRMLNARASTCVSASA
jgi:glutathione synthase/RimK-type ligase-like ATP-grasp enzyme